MKLHIMYNLALAISSPLLPAKNVAESEICSIKDNHTQHIEVLFRAFSRENIVHDTLVRCESSYVK